MRFGEESCKIIIITNISFYSVRKGKDRSCWIILESSALCAGCPAARATTLLSARSAGRRTTGLALQEKGKCIFEDLHKEGKAWEPPAPPEAPDPRTEIKDQECPVCGTLNAHSALFCNRCGASLTGEPQQYTNSNAGKGQETSPYGQVPPPAPRLPSGAIPRPGPALAAQCPPFPTTPWAAFPRRRCWTPASLFGDASKLVKQNTAYYMPVFRYMKQTGKNKFNFTAFLLSGPWMLYRKQYKYGTIVTVIMFALFIGLQAALYLVAAPLQLQLIEQVGIDATQTLYPTYEQQLAMSQILMQNPWQMFCMFLPAIILLCMLAVMIVVGVRGNKIYMRHCIRTARKVKAAGNDGDPNMTLDAKGGVNAPIAICLFVCYILIVNLPMWL